LPKLKKGDCGKKSKFDLWSQRKKWKKWISDEKKCRATKFFLFAKTFFCVNCLAASLQKKIRWLVKKKLQPGLPDGLLSNQKS
jgi:hypothetical protein